MLQRGRTRESAERHAPKQPETPHRDRFNGAALVRVRREFVRGSLRFSTRMLQRGRTRESAESLGEGPPLARVDFPLQRGRTRESAESSPAPSCAASRTSKLQRGRTRESAESELADELPLRLGLASTGPHS